MLFTFGIACHADGWTWSVTPQWEELYRVTDVQLDMGWEATVYGADGKIWFAPEGDYYFKSIDVTTGETVEHEMPPAIDTDADTEFCACGYGQAVVPLAGNVYMFGNAGQMFDGEGWTAVSYPDDARRGEAAGAAAGGLVYLIGGRGDLDTVETYSGGAEGTWETLGEPYPWGLDSALAYAPLGSDLIYVVGGANDDGRVYHGAVLDTSQVDAAWTPIADAPGTFLFQHGSIAEMDGDLLITDGESSIYTYDPGLDTWTESEVPVPSGSIWYLVMVDESAYSIGQDGADIYVKRLLPD